MCLLCGTKALRAEGQRNYRAGAARPAPRGRTRPVADFAGAHRSGHCPHCGVLQQYNAVSNELAAVQHLEKEKVSVPGPKRGEPNRDAEGVKLGLSIARCRSCRKVVLDLLWWKFPVNEKFDNPSEVYRLHPKRTKRPTVHEWVPAEITRMYEEAAAAESVSPRAAGALARACLQLVLHDRGFKASKLYDEIEAARKHANTSTILGEQLHMVRVVGNYSAHPTPDPAADQGSLSALLTVAPDELDLLFEALQGCFEAYYVEPIKHALRKRDLGKKSGKQLPGFTDEELEILKRFPEAEEPAALPTSGEPKALPDNSDGEDGAA